MILRKNGRALPAVILILASLLSVCFLSLSAINTAPYDHVIIIGVDGAGGFFEKVETPCFDQFFREGAVTYHMRATPPTSSAQGWGSLFYGVEPDIHRLTNEVAERIPCHNELLPSLFQLIGEAVPDSQNASIVGWPGINVGIIDCADDIYRFPSAEQEELTDREVIDECARYLEDHDPTLLYIQLNSVDEAGHQFGFGSDAYASAIRETDALLGELFDLLGKRMDPDRSLVIVMSDHGGTADGHHGGTSPEETEAMFAVRGRGIIPGEPIEDMEIRDAAPVVLYALGIDAPDSFTGRIPSGIFPDVGGGARPAGTVKNPSEAYRKHQEQATPDFPENASLNRKLAYRNTFEDPTLSMLDSVSGYFGLAADLSDSFCSTGIVRSRDWNGFSISFWIKAAPTEEDPVIAADKNWRSGKNPGFAVALVRNGVLFNLADCDSHRFDVRFPIPSDFYDGWTHYIFTVDKGSRSVTGYCDFEKLFSEQIDPALDLDDWFSGEIIMIGQDAAGTYNSALPAAIDEFMIFIDVLSEDDIRQLKLYYSEVVANQQAFKQ